MHIELSTYSYSSTETLEPIVSKLLRKYEFKKTADTLDLCRAVYDVLKDHPEFVEMAKVYIKKGSEKAWEYFEKKKNKILRICKENGFIN